MSRKLNLKSMKYIPILFIRCYQKFKPNKWCGCCIYEPTCSQYGILALKKYGFLKGISVTIDRIKRCDHKHKGGMDQP